jgi:hypothetical protein
MFSLNVYECVDGDRVVEYYGYDNLSVKTDALILSAIVLGTSILGLIMMYWRVSRRVG